jgi:aspartate/methionine/tyrosine aminotransferase
MLPPDEFVAIARWCEAEGVRLVSDEIYHGLSHGDLREETAAAHSAAPWW